MHILLRAKGYMGRGHIPLSSHFCSETDHRENDQDDALDSVADGVSDRVHSIESVHRDLRTTGSTLRSATVRQAS